MSKYRNKITSLFTVMAFVLCSYGEFFKMVSDEFKTLTAKAATIIYGDLDDDGQIDVFDSILLRRNANNNQFTATGDLDGNTIVDNTDVSLLHNFLLGDPREFIGSIRNKLNEADYSITFNGGSIETSMTKEMAEFTKKLGTPLAVYEYLYNNIDTSFYTNSRKGAIGTFEEKCGNDVDQANLLIAMLRSLGYEATYASSVIAITQKQLLDWTGCQSIESAKTTLSTGCRENAEYYEMVPIRYVFEHVFVITSIDSKIYYLDTSRRPQLNLSINDI